MKKFFCLAMLAFAFGFNANAQTVIENDYSPITQADGTSTTVTDNEDESIGAFNITYYKFDGFENWGFSDYFINPNSLGIDFAIRMNFKKYGNYNIDLGPNYAFKLWSNDNMRLFLIPALGPSFRMQEVPEVSVNKKTGKVTEETKTEYKFDFFANVRLTFCVGRFLISGGYFYWSPEFKFDGDTKVDGFNVSIGYDI